MPAEALARPTPSSTRAAFWAAALACDLVLLVFLARIPVVAAALGVALACVFLARRAEALLAFLFLGMSLLAPFHLRDANALATLLGLRLLLLGAWAITLGDEPRIGVGRAVGRALGDPVMLSTLGLALLLWVGLARTGAPLYGAEKLKSFVMSNVVFAAAPILLWTRWRSAGSLDRFLRAAIVLGALFAAAGLAAALGVGGAFARVGAPSPSGGIPLRLAWLGNDPIWTARLLAIWLVLLAWGATRRTIRPLPTVLLGVLGVYLLLRTGSRGPLAAMLFSPLALVLLPGPWSTARGRGAMRRVARLAIPALILLAIVVLIVLPGTERERMAAILLRTPAGEAGDAAGSILQDHSLAFRIEIVRRSLTALVEGLPWGWGTGGFTPALFLRDVRFYPHNLEAELLIEQGLPGFLLLMLMLIVCLVRARRLARISSTGHWLFLLACMALLNAQVSGDVTGNGEVWFWCGMISGVWLGAREPA